MNRPILGMIPCAGLGSRLLPITANLPKALVEIGGRSMLYNVVDKMHKAGFKEIAINVHHCPQLMFEAIEKIKARFAQISFHVFYEEELLDIGGGIKNVIEQCAVSEIFIHNVDSYIYGTDSEGKYIQRILQHWKPQIMEALLYLKNGGEDFILCKDGKIKRDALNNDYQYVGVGIYRSREILSVSRAKFHLMRDHLFSRLDMGNVYPILLKSNHIDLGTIADLNLANTM